MIVFVSPFDYMSRRMIVFVSFHDRVHDPARMIVFIAPFGLHVPPHDRVRLSIRLHVPPHDRVHLSIGSCPAARSCSSLHRFMSHRMIVFVSPFDSMSRRMIVFASPFVTCPAALSSFASLFKFRVACVVVAFVLACVTVLCCFSLRRLWHIRCLSTAAFVSTLRRHVSAVIRLGLLRFEGGRTRCCRPSALLSVPSVSARLPVLGHAGQLREVSELAV